MQTYTFFASSLLSLSLSVLLLLYLFLRRLYVCRCALHSESYHGDACNFALNLPMQVVLLGAAASKITCWIICTVSLISVSLVLKLFLKSLGILHY